MNTFIRRKHKPFYRKHVDPLTMLIARLRYLLSFSLLMILLACASENTTGSQSPPAGVAGDGNLDTALEFIRNEYNLPALGAMLIRGDEVIEMGAVGVRAIGFKETVTIQDRWHLGSITKAMTATVAARLVESGEVSWDLTVAAVFPDMVGSIRSEYEPVRLDEFLYHTSGLPADITRTPSWPTLRTDTSPLPAQRRRWAAELLSLEPETSRGTHLYSNAGYVVAGSMLEELTGKTWEELMQQELFTPLGMQSSDFGAPGSAGNRDQPWGHLPQGNGWRALQPGPDADNPAALGPAGTAHTTFSDFAKYMVAHLAGARGDAGLVSAASFLKLHNPASGTDYALGWGVGQRSWANGRVLQHSGSNTAWFANLWLAPERDFAMLAVSNAGGNDAFQATDTVILALIERFDAAFGEMN